MTDHDWRVQAAQGPGRPPKYPLATMGVGEVFAIPVGTKQPQMVSLRSYLSMKGGKLGRKFLCHQYEDGRIEIYRSE